MSGAAATVVSGLGNVVVGGDGYADYYYPLSYPESLNVTNLYWNYLSPIYSLNLAPGAVATGGMIILYGGTDGINTTSAAIGYDPSGDPPLMLASMSVPRSYLGYARDASGKAYAIGGLDANNRPLSSAERFNLDSGPAGAWSAIASLPAARYDFPAVFDHTNQIYIFGGRTNTISGTEIGSVLRYSVSRNTWTNLASLPVAIAGSAAAFGADGKIYVVGGVSGGVTTNVVQVYNPAANAWTISTPLPEGLSASAMGVDSLGRLIVMGGMDTNGLDVGDVWRSQQLNVPDSAPVVTQYPATNGTYLTAYTSSINATGSPPPTYQLISGPVDMQVDQYGGAITWTPQGLAQIGAIPVTIRAANYAGYADWTFTITVPNPPPAVLTNLTVVSVTESSVTLSWAPEDVVAGPVTYSVWLRHVLHSPKGSGATIWYTQIGSTTTVPTITISGLAADLTQTYYVVATGPGGKSPYAGISASTLPAPAPTNLRVAGLTSTTITLAWDAPTGGSIPVANYEVLGWYNGIAAQYPLAYPNINGTTVTITGLAPGTAMLWGVSARDTAGNVSAYDYLPSLIVNPVPVPPTLSLSLANVVVPRVSGVVSQPGGGFQFIVTEGGSVLQTVLIQAATNLAGTNAWVQIGSVYPTANPFTFTDTNSAQYPARYYRVLAP